EKNNQIKSDRARNFKQERELKTIVIKKGKRSK
ncbi:MAG: hypothetical protein ACJAT9_001576, partial [Polaribacter sp.]